MADFNPLSFIQTGMGGGGITTLILALTIGLAGLMIAGFIVYSFWRWRKWSLKVEFKLPRSVKYGTDTNIQPDDVSGFVDSEWGKGYYNSKTGVVWLKRKKKPKVSMKPFNLARALQGSNCLTVVQTGAETYMPVFPESYLIYQNEQGEEFCLLNVKADLSESKAWKNTFEREAKSAYSIVSLLREYAPMIAIGLVIVLWGIQFIMIRRGMCGS